MNSVFEYKEGHLYWKINSRKGFAGRRAGKYLPNGYEVITYQGKMYYTHRLVWLLFNGPIPDGMEIDHIDRDRSNNRIENLRLATRSQNRVNTGLRSDSTSGFKGVWWSKQKSKWGVNLWFNNKKYFLGYYNDVAVAAEAYQAKAKELHGEFYVSAQV